MSAERGVHTAFVGVGSNLGDRRANVNGALIALGEIPGLRVRRFSSIIETAPVGGPEAQPDYLNAAACLDVRLDPHAVLEVLLAIEGRFGRRRAERWGPRTLDLDLLLYDDAVIQTEALCVPHPRMHERRFVLEPLCEIAPDVVHPILLLTVRELLERLP